VANYSAVLKAFEFAVDLTSVDALIAVAYDFVPASEGFILTYETGVGSSGTTSRVHR
jgi:hypothetical protein